MTAQTGSLNRIPELDGLGGVAILLVFGFHYLNNQLVDSAYSIGRIVYKVTSIGWIGVDLFFVLSGFLIGSILLRTRQSDSFFRTFYFRRIARIVPNYFLILAVFMIIKSIPYFSSNYFLAGNDVIPGWAYFTMLNNIYMALLNNMGNPAMSISWSIAIEEQFYILFPFMVYFIREKWLPWFLLLVIVAACLTRMSFSGWIPAYVLLPSRMDSIAFGVLVAYVNWKSDLPQLVAKYFYPLIVLMGLDFLLCGYLSVRYGDLGVVKHSLFAFLFAGCLLFALTMRKSLYSSLLRNGILGWIGSISYSLYLVHYFMLGFVHHLFGNAQGIGIRSGRDLLVTAIAIAASFTMAWMIFKMLETPLIQWARRTFTY